MLFSQESGYEIFLNDVIRLLTERNYTAALALFNDLPPEYSGNTDVRILRAIILNSAGRTSEAVQAANQILASESNNTEALMVLADAAAIDGRERDRRNFLERVLTINPSHVRALTDLGNLSLGNQNLFVAGTYFDRALAAEPDNGEALVGRAVVYRYQREARRSEQLLDRAVSLYPGWARPLQERARLYRSGGFLEDALEDLNDAILIEPYNGWMFVDRGLVLIDIGRKQDALIDFALAAEYEPELFLAYVYSAGIREELGDYDGAIQDYIKLTAIRPEYYFGFESLGALYMHKKQWAQARNAFLSAWEQIPSDNTYALLTALCWMRSDGQAAPRQYLAAVLRNAPRNTLEYNMLRLYHDLSGDLDVVVRVESETDVNTKARMLFYLASYYDIRGNRTLADRYYLMMQDIGDPYYVEWRLNEWALKERGLGIRAFNE